MPNIRKHVDEEKLMPQINKYADRCITNSCIDPALYDKYNVKSG